MIINDTRGVNEAEDANTMRYTHGACTTFYDQIKKENGLDTRLRLLKL